MKKISSRGSNEKKLQQYEAPQMEVVDFEVTDVITTSGDPNTDPDLGEWNES